MPEAVKMAGDDCGRNVADKPETMNHGKKMFSPKIHKQERKHKKKSRDAHRFLKLAEKGTRLGKDIKRAVFTLVRLGLPDDEKRTFAERTCEWGTTQNQTAETETKEAEETE